ncbi:SWIM zinc finger family protein [Ferruginibacter sp.]|nr:SWIM zinc finger family protein [Ferruginibacter sp.]
MQLSEEQILTLAPDEASKKSGKDLANPSKWVSKGANEQALWGEAQGSGSKPYQTQIDLSNIAFKCSCPSRKFPCKHGIGLMLFYARQKNVFTDDNAPAWVTDWLNKRAEKEEKKVTQEDKPVDEAAQAKRQLARQQKVIDGIEELCLWIKDIVRNGILSMPEKGAAFFENMAKRMVDAQAPGLANMVRNLGDVGFYNEGWQNIFMNQLVSIYLITEGFKNSNTLNENLLQDIRTWIGFTQSQEELKEQNGITDTWLVLSKQTIEVDNITTERNWLYGTQSNQYALVLQFIVRGQGGQLSFTPGMFIQAELVFYPGVAPLRAIIKKQITSNAVNNFTAFNNWQQVADMETTLCRQMPVKSERPFIIQQLTPVQYNNHWWLQDAAKNMMAIKNEQRMIWKLLAMSGGEALDMVVIGKEDKYEPVGVWYNAEYKIL